MPFLFFFFNICTGEGTCVHAFAAYYVNFCAPAAPFRLDESESRMNSARRRSPSYRQQWKIPPAFSARHRDTPLACRLKPSAGRRRGPLRNARAPVVCYRSGGSCNPRFSARSYLYFLCVFPAGSLGVQRAGGYTGIVLFTL